MNILFLHSGIPNYVTDGLFHGLRSINGINVVDIPRIDYMYTDASCKDLEKTGSKGNTLYHLLTEAEEIKGMRTYWQADLDDYDFIIFNDIFHLCDQFHYIYNSLKPSKRNSICIIDGYDAASMFPFIRNSFNLKIRPWSYFYKTKKVKYFKREFVDVASLFGLSKECFPRCHKLFSKIFNRPVKLFPISMSIPEEHVEYIPMAEKSTTFIRYNVDEELGDLLPNTTVAELGKWQPAFSNQQQYYDEIRNSMFGITAKRAGWDCLRHYEYAAKGAILCFKNLEKKDPLCAPLALNETNCIPYSGKTDLLSKITKMSFAQLQDIQAEQYKWVNEHTTKNAAYRFLERLQSDLR
ncbi:hypothetical protein QTN47_20710 [Danxiaibacter flavus]|uniref:Glycosyltransferase family 1 protein n=1 Tax=Danxiaibacter flavus TaxID=3049108 RepID=A0ABV3ZJ78_9BACT|nr:hypothetical protein QNM32_20715 [Chitinophagaceae bacterium DXS]